MQKDWCVDKDFSSVVLIHTLGFMIRTWLVHTKILKCPKLGSFLTIIFLVFFLHLPKMMNNSPHNWWYSLILFTNFWVVHFPTICFYLSQELYPILLGCVNLAKLSLYLIILTWLIHDWGSKKEHLTFKGPQSSTLDFHFI